MVTTLGYFLIPLGLALLVLPIRYLIAATIIFSVFVSGSVLNLEAPITLGMQPGFYFCILLTARFLVTFFLKGEISGSLRMDPVYGALLGFVVYGAWSAFFCPFIFAGTQVYNPRLGLDTTQLQQLSFGPTNLNQVVYLICYGLFSATLFGYLRTNSRSAVLALKTYIFSFWIVIAFAFYDAGSTAFALPSLRWLFDNPIYGRGTLQTIQGIVRPQSTFPEPSVLGQYLVGMFSYFLACCLYAQATVDRIAGLVACCLILSLDRSATGIGGAIVMTMVVFAVCRPTPRMFIGITVLTLFCIGMFFVLPDFGINLADLLDKFDTISGRDRLRADGYSVGLLRQTFGLGAGLGSNRSSSLLVSLASTIGIPGLLFAAVLIKRLHSCVARYARERTPVEELMLWPPYLLFIGQCVAGCIGVPDISSLTLWTAFTLAASLPVVVASRRSCWVEARLAVKSPSVSSFCKS